MIPRRAVLAACLCLVLGCAESCFESEADELRYLTTIYRPTPTQWNRRKELQAKAYNESHSKGPIDLIHESGGIFRKHRAGEPLTK